MQQIIDKISQRRRQVLVHSCIYYEFNTNIIEDNEYDAFARELKQLVKEYPNKARQAEMNYIFEEWDKHDCISGYDLPIRGQWVLNKAQQLIEQHDKINA